MRLILLAAAALVAATSADARPKKKTEEAPPPPEPAFELQDDRLGEALAEACLAEGTGVETYDSRDNIMIGALAGGGRAIIHFSGGCSTNIMIFADRIEAKDGGRCVSPGDALHFVDGMGGVSSCEVKSVNRWLDDIVIEDGDESY